MKSKKNKQTRKWNTVRITGIGFLVLILLGSVLLWLPISNYSPITYFDALFTAVSAICVTGLVTVVPATQFTIFGKIILLLLIQIGGLGIITLSTTLFMVLRIQISVRERVAMLESFGMGDLGGIVNIVVNIILGTFSVEAIGALGYAIQFIPEFGFVKGCGYAIFHSISCFCNAGIDIIGSNSFEGYLLNPIINITTILLIIISGIGFSVWFDVARVLRKKWHRERLFKGYFKELTLHSKLAISITAFLIVFGTILILLLEYKNPATIGNLNFPQKMMAALFQSVTDRTAGFATFDQGDMKSSTKLINIIIMFVGGSPGGTAGGVKTTTIALLFMTMFSVINGGNELEAFGRRIPRDLIRTALTIVLFFIIFLLAGNILILTFEPDTTLSIDVLYETTSALCTVGLSAGLTSTLCMKSQVVLMILMYLGRLGPMTMALMLIGKPHPRDRIRVLPQENIMIG